MKYTPPKLKKLGKLSQLIQAGSGFNCACPGPGCGNPFCGE